MVPCQDELIELFGTLINVMFCIKNVDGTYAEVNGAFVRRTGRSSKREVIGHTAGELFIPELAERYEEQDHLVFTTGKPMRDELELIRRPNGELGWYLTTKLPIFGRDEAAGAVVALASVSRDLDTPTSENIVLESLQSVVGHVRAHVDQVIRVNELAEAADCTVAQLERRMRRVFGLTPTQYLLRVRVDAAAQMLADGAMPLAEIATACGFYDQSDFTRRFARLTNQTPAQFRASAAHTP